MLRRCRPITAISSSAAGHSNVCVSWLAAPGQYTPIAPVFITRDDALDEVVEFQAALPVADSTDAGLVSDEVTRRYATREARYRLHQHRFRANVLRAYRTRCHLAYDRNLLGIAPDGVVHIASRLLSEIDGPMLRVGLQGFHEAAINQPRDRRDRPDPARLKTRFERFESVG